VLAKNIVVQCGRFSLIWSALEHLSLSVRQGFPPALRIFGQRSLRYDTLSQRPRGRDSLSDLFAVHHKSACLDIRDKVFDLLGMSARCCQVAVDVNYNESNSEFCRRFLIHHIKREAFFSDSQHVSYFARLACPLFSVTHSDNRDSNQPAPEYEAFPLVFVECRYLGGVRQVGSVGSGNNSAEENVLAE
jgi:hypothetical protein